MCASLRDDARDYNIQALNASSDDCHEKYYVVEVSLLMELRRISKHPSVTISFVRSPTCSPYGIDLLGLILQLLELALSTVNPHEENGSKHRQN